MEEWRFCFCFDGAGLALCGEICVYLLFLCDASGEEKAVEDKVVRRSTTNKQNII